MSTPEDTGSSLPDYTEPPVHILGPDGKWMVPSDALHEELSQEWPKGWSLRREDASLKADMAYEDEWPDTMLAPGKWHQTGALYSPGMQDMFEERELELTTKADDPSMVEMFKSYEVSLELGQIVDSIAAGVEAQFQIAEFNATEDAAEPKVIFGEGVAPIIPLTRYPRVERLADWRTEGKPGKQPDHSKPDARLQSRVAGSEYWLLEDDEPGINEPFVQRFTNQFARTRLQTRAMYRAYEERDAELLRSRQAVDEAFEGMEAIDASEKAEAERLAEAETEAFETIENRLPASPKSILDSPLFSLQSVQEFRNFQSRRRAA